jgi:hypothetical protein
LYSKDIRRAYWYYAIVEIARSVNAQIEKPPRPVPAQAFVAQISNLLA